MPISFMPKRGQILMCDYTNGFVPPEMQKIRHCIVISPERKTGTCIVVPLSTVPPSRIEAYHYKMPRNVYQCLECGTDVWVKADMITHASFQRLDRPKENGRFASVFLKTEHLTDITDAVLAAIGHPKFLRPLSYGHDKVEPLNAKGAELSVDKAFADENTSSVEL